MPRLFTCLALFGTALLAPLSGSAQTAALLAVGDATQLSELRLAKVMADESSLWLSVRLQGRTRLALVTEEASVETAPTADAWLGALDFATRVRVAAPPGALASCGSIEQFELADSGLPEPRRVTALEVSSASSELELRRLLADAGLPAEVDRVAQFASQARPPFQVLIYDVPAFGGSTEAVRLIDRSHPAELPRITLSGASSIPLSLIALAEDGARPGAEESADASEFPVAYRAIDESSDYLAARRGWLAQNPTRWLNEVQASAALFTGTVLPAGARIAPVVSHYFEQLSGTPRGGCERQVLAAHERASVNPSDFVCAGADDLARTLAEVGFADLRLSRFFGMASADGTAFRVAVSAPRSPLLLATDFDQSGCPSALLPPENPANDPPVCRPPSVSSPPVVVGAPDDPYYAPSPIATPASESEGSSTVTVYGSSDSCSGNTSSGDSSSDSCSGDSSSGDSSSDSCSGDTSSEDSSGDSCSGDSSSDDSGPDSCSGDASDSSSDSCGGDSDSSSDSSGCGKSDYDGDTCSGNSASGNSAKKTAGLRSPTTAHARQRPRPRQVRLSLLTLLAAALALPLRRLRASR